MTAKDPAWQARLRAALGTPVSGLDWEKLESLCGTLREDEDLDFKSALYGNTDSDRRELAGDIAAMANRRGGLLLIGVEERDGVAVALRSVTLSDGEEGRMRQIAAQLIAPFADFQIGRISSADAAGRGVFVLSVPPSRERPHAVRVNNALRYPVRDGTTTRWLAETEVRAAYRSSFDAAQDMEAAVTRAGDTLEAQLDRDKAWAVVTLVPASSAEFEITSERIRSVEEWAHQFALDDLIGGWLGREHPRCWPDARRIVLASHHETGASLRYHGAHLHVDGTAAVAHCIPNRSSESEEVFPVFPEQLAELTAKCLSVAARHAAENCGAYGEAILEFRLLAPKPLQLQHLRDGFLDAASDRTAAPPIRTHRAAPLNALLEPQEILAATRLLTNEGMNAMGAPELRHIAPGGALRLAYWRRPADVERWAAARGVETTNDQVG